MPMPEEQSDTPASLQLDDAPIAAIATPSGSGAVGIIRLSGGDLSPILQTLLCGDSLPARKATVRAIRDDEGELIDEPLLLHFPPPHSYTGEEVLEIHAHGNPLLLDRLMALLCALGARPARAGEFSQRAFLNGRLDLAQAEAVADLIAASSDTAMRAAARSMKGAFSKEVDALMQGIVDVRAHAEASLDFPTEELEPHSSDELSRRLGNLLGCLDSLLQGARGTVVLGEGTTVALIGRPNSGKSSLLNALAGESLAIVADTPGTTRDLIRARLTLGGLSATVTDTAGLHRQAADSVEQQGMERSRTLIQQTDILLLVGEVGDDFAALPHALGVAELLADLLEDGSQTRLLCICNKIDLADESWQLPDEVIAVSALTGEGLDNLQRAIGRLAGLDRDGQSDFLARRRHLYQLQQARARLNEAGSELQNGRLELAAEQMRLALTALGEITGACTSEDLLARIFADFCIGK